MKKLTIIMTAFCSLLMAIPNVAKAEFGDYEIHRFVSGMDKWNVNSFWLETDETIVLIEGQFHKSDAKLLAAMIKTTGKPVAGAIITHAHPDHYAGINTLKDELGDFPVIITQKTQETFDAEQKRFLPSIARRFGDLVDDRLVIADRIIENSGEIELGGIKFIVDEVGVGEGESGTLLYQPDQNILFTGDVTMHHSHLIITDGRTKEIIDQLQHIQTTYPDIGLLYSSHGDPANLSHINTLINYAKDIELVAKKAIKVGGYMKEDGTGYNREVLMLYVDEIMEKYNELGDFGFPILNLVGGNIADAIKVFNEE